MNERIRIGHVAQRERENGWFVFVLTARPEYAEDRVKFYSTDSCKTKSTLVNNEMKVNKGEDVLNNPKIGVEVSERDTQGNDTTLSALNNDNKYKLDTEYTIQ